MFDRLKKNNFKIEMEISSIKVVIRLRPLNKIETITNHSANMIQKEKRLSCLQSDNTFEAITNKWL